MGNVEKALLLSLCLHALVAAGIVFMIERRPPSIVSPSLEVSSVELSLGEPEGEYPRNPAAVARPVPQEIPSPEEQKAPERADAEALPESPAVPGAVEIPIAKEPAVEMKIEKTVQKSATAAPDRQAADQAQVDAPARPKRSIKPVYPASSRRRNEQGLVKLNLTIDAFGAVSEVSIAVSSGFADLDAAAVKAVRSALFLPARRGEEQVESTIGMTFSFRLK